RQVAAEQEACRRELTELKDRRESVLKEIEAAGNDDGVAFEIDAVEREQERLQVDSAGIRDRMMEIRLQLQSTEERIESVKRETERLDEETHRLTDLATRLRDQATKKRAQRTAAQTDRQALEGELTHGMQAMPGMKQQVGNIQAQLERTCQAEKELATQLADLEKKDRQLERELSDIRVRQAGMTSAAEALTADAFGDLDTAADDLGRIPDGDEIEDWRKQIDILQSNLDMLGDVNLAAEQEHRELVERNRFLDEQIRDLQDSIASLRATIQQINKASRIRFSEAFETVNTHFGQVFQRLFSGGDAFLELIHPDDPLESGVDIVCKPPGKRARTIDLLSGGEKALAALALLLAGFRYRPSPLLFLDEVDAPLDDANVERFTEFLKELAEVTQVVMVTHNATTMEAADVLYGITMEEPGISRLVSARLAML
ncbi:AAA family ATPase, partial [bacterium]|nr:AAA family ATPase [candidate division CSSED10-310 bacterium]